ncbi:unnamed protein product [Thlaspi arvense]|uniref:Uncharacterized protein n=1 Tax=Thlaspi arvense TaxID=13288 RepID=A0AAU9S9C5_THLAR|nr:unnamed protein product [Thlaspi arvense]
MSNSDHVMFSVNHGGYWVKNHVGDVGYISGEVVTFECNPEDFFSALQNELSDGEGFYGHYMWYKLPFEDNKERKRLIGGDSKFQRMCEADGALVIMLSFSDMVLKYSIANPHLSLLCFLLFLLDIQT